MFVKIKDGNEIKKSTGGLACMRKPDEYAKKISNVFPKSLHLSKSTEICTYVH